jgi:hypothetical protein
MSDDIVVSGWGVQEKTHRWTIGNEASMTLKMDQVANDKIILRVLAIPYLVQGKIDGQRINVIANNHQVAEWIMHEGGWFEAPIRASLVGEDGLINVVFKISDPASPAQFGHSSDSRKLGMAVRELVIKAVH